MTSYTLELLAKYRAEGFTILADDPPPVGQPVFVARVFTMRGMGGSIQGTKRLGVTAVRLTSGQYWDMTNNEQVASSELEAWKVSA